MASYLVALVSGEFDELQDESDGCRLRVIATEGKKVNKAVMPCKLCSQGPAWRIMMSISAIKYPLPEAGPDRDTRRFPAGRYGELGRHHF